VTFEREDVGDHGVAKVSQAEGYVCGTVNKLCFEIVYTHCVQMVNFKSFSPKENPFCNVVGQRSVRLWKSENLRVWSSITESGFSYIRSGLIDLHYKDALS